MATKRVITRTSIATAVALLGFVALTMTNDPAAGVARNGGTVCVTTATALFAVLALRWRSAACLGFGLAVLAYLDATSQQLPSRLLEPRLAIAVLTLGLAVLGPIARARRSQDRAPTSSAASTR